MVFSPRSSEDLLKNVRWDETDPRTTPVEPPEKKLVHQNVFKAAQLKI